MWLLTGHDACSAVLRSESFSAASGQQQRSRDVSMPKSMLNTDGAEHARLRAPAALSFGARRISELTDVLCHEAARIVSSLPPEGAGEIDVVEEVGAPFATAVLGRVLGVGPAGWEELGSLAGRASPNLDPLLVGPALSRASAASADLTRFLGEHARKAAALGPDEPLAGMLSSPDLTDEEKVGVLSLIVVGGYDPLVNVVGNGVDLLLRHATSLEALGSLPPAAMATVVEEVLRMESPIPFAVRVSVVDVEVAGMTISAGQPVLVHLGAANRDPAKFTLPDVFMPDRSPNPHLAFGGGVHFCLGAAIVRLAGSAMIGELLRARPGMKGAPGAPARWRRPLVPRGLESLKVVW